MKRRTRIILISIVLGVVVAAGTIGYFVWRSVNEVWLDAYSGWLAAEMVIEYMETHDKVWPKSWTDLQGTFGRASLRVRGLPLTFEEVRRRVDVDFTADPAVLAKAFPNEEHPAFRVIRLRNGHFTYWQAHEPNCTILWYLKELQAGSQTAPASAPNPPDTN